MPILNRWSLNTYTYRFFSIFKMRIHYYYWHLLRNIGLCLLLKIVFLLHAAYYFNLFMKCDIGKGDAMWNMHLITYAQCGIGSLGGPKCRCVFFPLCLLIKLFPKLIHDRRIDWNYTFTRIKRRYAPSNWWRPLIFYI